MIDNMNRFHAELLDNPVQIEDGHVVAPNRPGLDVQLNEDVARANPYNRDKLHLKMNAEPYDNAHSGEFGGG